MENPIADLYSEDQWLAWIDELSDKDIVTIDNFLPADLWLKTRAFLDQKIEEDDFQKAGVGALAQNQIIEAIRGDHTFWLESERDFELTLFFQVMEQLLNKLNRYCYLSLSGSEFHLAHYPPGSYYKKHVDQFNSRSNRMITVIIYLNKDWKKGNGGELKVYKEEEDYIIDPIQNRCVIFKSADIPHEVLPTNVDRYSLTGWLLYQPSGIGFLS